MFVVSILGEHKPYSFPLPIKLDKSIKDILENEVEEKYYMNKPFKLVDKGRIKAEFINVNFEQGKRIYGIDSYFQTLSAADRGTNNILIDAYLKGEDIELPCICASRGRNPINPSSRITGLPTKQFLEINKNRTSNTITTVQKDNYAIEKNYRVRKLTPLECWRLMAFTDEDFYKAKNVGVSNSQLYKQAGNSIVVKVLEGIFKELFLSEKENNERDFEIVKLGNKEVEQFKWVI